MPPGISSVKPAIPWRNWRTMMTSRFGVSGMMFTQSVGSITKKSRSPRLVWTDRRRWRSKMGVEKTRSVASVRHLRAFNYFRPLRTANDWSVRIVFAPGAIRLSRFCDREETQVRDAGWRPVVEERRTVIFTETSWRFQTSHFVRCGLRPEESLSAETGRASQALEEAAVLDGGATINHDRQASRLCAPRRVEIDHAQLAPQH